ncbi:Haloacid dehalogenase-like hydrolase [Colletotrichum higginsianum IMI 349063]|uniref:Haloacid dehalogenase-like hydrolase n=3 Tax=Colletotrichum higginsianum TaxID=80884 RepID=A0A1B7Y653_COLHI|nr:Haloacid dehalogenase-like hydrolase [Colletotrichum higginsianum IMI 349063]OBR07456.1 Haloacid dehalogenase-like hydrolase [Colletotrichum higginsianum IMI 349063]
MKRFISSMTAAPRRFAPLKPGAAPNSNAPRLKGIVFDVDGTLCEPQNYMFSEMRQALGITKSIDILDHIYALPTKEAQETAMESIRQIERTAMASQVAQPGLTELMSYLDSRGVRKGICTRNFDAPVAHLLGKFLEGSLFEPVVTRDFRPPKPDPAGILHIARTWGLVKPAKSEADREPRSGIAPGAEGPLGDASELIMVGDSIDDMTAGRRAGAATVLLANDVNLHLADHEHTDLVIHRLDELIPILEEGFSGRELAFST